MYTVLTKVNNVYKFKWDYLISKGDNHYQMRWLSPF